MAETACQGEKPCFRIRYTKDAVACYEKVYCREGTRLVDLEAHNLAALLATIRSLKRYHQSLAELELRKREEPNTIEQVEVDSQLGGRAKSRSSAFQR